MYDQQCKDCRYFEKEKGECRIRSPQFASYGNNCATKWPSVFPDQWCGEWKEKRND
jgi:hypothetical protein